MTIGRPTLFSQGLVDKITERLMAGESLRQICVDADMPDRVTVIRWMAKDPAFATIIAHARDEQADLMDDLILEVANASTPETAASDRVKIAAYQWRAGKLKAKKYGDASKHTIAGPDDGPVQVEHSIEDNAKALAFMLSSADKGE
jgi:hypothetical protein